MGGSAPKLVLQYGSLPSHLGSAPLLRRGCIHQKSTAATHLTTPHNSFLLNCKLADTGVNRAWCKRTGQNGLRLPNWLWCSENIGSVVHVADELFLVVLGISRVAAKIHCMAHVHAFKYAGPLLRKLSLVATAMRPHPLHVPPRTRTSILSTTWPFRLSVSALSLNCFRGLHPFWFARSTAGSVDRYDRGCPGSFGQ